MSGNTLTVISAMAGIVVGFLTSWWFSWSGKRHAQAERAILVSKITSLQGILSGVAESISAKPMIASAEVDQALHALPDKAAGDVVTSLRSAASASTTDVFVRASLGALLNERGEVSVPRLLQEVAHSLPEASLSSVQSSLEQLRESGRVSWSGNDVRKAEVIRVHP